MWLPLITEVSKCGLRITLFSSKIAAMLNMVPGYGDSSPVEPSEGGLVEDGIFMYKWLEKQANGNPLFVWGHSLGTGWVVKLNQSCMLIVLFITLALLFSISTFILLSVSSHALAILSSEGSESYGLVLEAPFNNMRDELRGHPLAQVILHCKIIIKAATL